MELPEEDVLNSNITLLAMYQDDFVNICHKTGINVKIIVMVTFIMANIGNTMLLGVIHFEKFGQDPMKRLFPDRMFANVCWLHMYVSFVNSLIEVFLALIGKSL